MNAHFLLAGGALALGVALQPAWADSFSITLADAEKQALRSSDLLKAYSSDELAAGSQADAQYQALLPKLAFSGSYQYLAYVPQINLPGFPPIPFGTNSTFNVGPTLTYTLFDGSSNRDAYRALSILHEARQADRDNAGLQLLLSLRADYIQVQLGLEELRLIDGSLDLARAQLRDVNARFRAGAATRLDVVTAERSVLSYEIQFKERQAELSASLKDLMTLLGDHGSRDLSHPGPPSTHGVTLSVKLEPLEQLLTEQGRLAPAPASSPDDTHPQIRSQELQSQSYTMNAESESERQYPSVQLSAGVSLNHPDIPEPTTYWQETAGVALSMPIYFGDPSRYYSAQQRSQADAAEFRASQLKDNLRRDFAKASEMLSSLREQRSLALRDIDQSEEEARLYYISYKNGKLNFIDVQNANNQALQAKVSAARIDAQILNQIAILRSLSDSRGERPHD